MTRKNISHFALEKKRDFFRRCACARNNSESIANSSSVYARASLSLTQTAKKAKTNHFYTYIHIYEYIHTDECLWQQATMCQQQQRDMQYNCCQSLLFASGIFVARKGGCAHRHALCCLYVRVLCGISEKKKTRKWKEKNATQSTSSKLGQHHSYCGNDVDDVVVVKATQIKPRQRDGADGDDDVAVLSLCRTLLAATTKTATATATATVEEESVCRRVNSLIGISHCH